MLKKMGMIGAVLFWVIWAFNCWAAEASFDCSKASAPVEKAICGDGKLGELDKILGNKFNEVKIQLSAEQKAELIKQQRKWLKDRLTNCNTLDAEYSDQVVSSCLISLYQKRIEELNAISSNIPKAASIVPNAEMVVKKLEARIKANEQCIAENKAGYERCYQQCGGLNGRPFATPELRDNWIACYTKYGCDVMQEKVKDDCTRKTIPRYEEYRKCEDSLPLDEKKKEINCSSIQCKGLQLSVAQRSKDKLYKEKAIVHEECVIAKQCYKCSIQFLPEYQ
jgi:uncharacterized protein